MTLERRIRSLLYPITRPAHRRKLIDLRDGVVSLLAHVRGTVGGTRPLPDFVIAGTQKGGTTFLFHELLRHPDVRGPLTKEVHFFDGQFEKGVNWYRGMFPRRKAGDSFLVGEASPVYMFHPDAMRRLSTVVPDAKVIVVLRDPVKRALSHYSHERRLGFEPCETLDEALSLEADRISHEYELVQSGQLASSFAVGHYSYTRRGHYAAQLKRIVELLGRDQLMVVISEEMYVDPQAVVRSVLDFVGAPEWSVPAPKPNDMAFDSESMDESTELRLREQFREPNAELEQFLGRPLPWPT